MQHIVRHIDDVVDRTLTSGFDGILEPLRAGTDLHTFDANRSIMWASFRGADFDAGNERFAITSVFGAGFDFWVFYREAELGGKFASDTNVAEHIDAVRSDL